MKVKGFESYTITRDGRVLNKSGKELKGFINRGGYRYVDLSNNGVKQRFAVHRLVVEHYLEGTGEVVHHKDGNTLNNSVENLEWITQKENIRHSYEKMSQVRNYRECQLLKDGVLIGHFQSVSEACRHASKHYGASFSSLSKYRKTKGFEVLKV